MFSIGLYPPTQLLTTKSSIVVDTASALGGSQSPFPGEIAVQADPAPPPPEPGTSPQPACHQAD